MAAQLPSFTERRVPQDHPLRDVFTGALLYSCPVRPGKVLWLWWTIGAGVERCFDVLLGWSPGPEDLPHPGKHDQRLYALRGPTDELPAAAIHLQQILGEAAIGGFTIATPLDQLLAVKVAAPQREHDAAMKKAFTEVLALSDDQRRQAVRIALGDVFKSLLSVMPTFIKVLQAAEVDATPEPAHLPLQPISDQHVLNYLRLEEDDSTVELLRPGSVRYIGRHQAASGVFHYWSYPTAGGVAWAAFNPGMSLGLCEDPPPSIRKATSAREDHKMRKVKKQAAALPLAMRTKPDRAVWVALADLPACHYHQAWQEHASFESALKHYGAKVINDSSAGPGTRLFYIQLTSGRYACIESRRDFPQTVIISLEVDTRKAGKNSGGKVYVRDIEEILGPMGGAFKMPTANLHIGWQVEEDA